MSRPRLHRAAALLLLVAVASSCAYYNTFYLARKYYMKATSGQPYEVDRENTTQRQNYTKSGDYSKKLLGVYPNSKYVDDAWLMWARTLVGTDDPLKAVTMLQEFATRFPNSELRPDAEFFLGLSYRLARKHEQAVAAFDEFLVQAPKHALVPYAYYERSKSFLSLQRYREAAESAGEILKRFPKHPIYDRALRQRAESRYQQHDWAGARADFRVIGSRALTDDERLRFLLREVDCLESSRTFEEARALLNDARSHVLPPPPLPEVPRVGSTGTLPNTQQVSVVRTPAQEVYGRLTLRMGGVELLAGHVDQAVEYFRSVLHDYPRSQLGAEAQFRVGFAYETGADDFQKARAEYVRVREQTGTSQFAQQAQARLDNLDRIDRFRTAGGADSLARKAEARFLIAEHYLFNLDRPERALEEYRSIFDSVSIASVQARALNAQAWVLSRKLDRKGAGDSLFWRVVREFPATEAQLAARDYLEASGQVVPERLIVAPKEIAKPLLDTDDDLTKPPGGTPRLGARKEASIAEPGAVQFGPGVTPPGTNPTSPSQWRNSTLPDSVRHLMAVRDSLIRLARSDTSAAGRARVDSLRRILARPDTLGRGAIMAQIAREVARADSVVVAPEPDAAPNLSAVDSLETDAVAPAGPAPLPASSPVDAPSAARAGADSTKHVVRTDSTHKSALSPKRVYTRADSVLAARRDSTRAARWTPAQRDSARRATARRDSLEKRAAVRDSVKRVAAKRDSVKRAVARADSLAGKTAAPPAAARPAPARPDTTRNRQP